MSVLGTESAIDVAGGVLEFGACCMFLSHENTPSHPPPLQRTCRTSCLFVSCGLDVCLCLSVSRTHTHTQTSPVQGRVRASAAVRNGHPGADAAAGRLPGGQLR